MKRLISVLLSVLMLLSMLSTTGMSFVLASGNPFASTDYAPLFDNTAAAYNNTFIINSAWSLTSATEGSTQLSFTFGGKTVTETYDASRHFTSFSAASAAWKAANTSGGALTNTYATAVPNFVFAPGTYSEKVEIQFSANIYGAQAGISPNDPSFSIDNALPTSDWNVNSARNGSTNETVLSGGIFRTNMVDGSATDTTYDALLKAASVTQYTVNIDGVKLTSETAFGQKDLVYSTGAIRTSKVNIYNTIFQGNKYGVSAAGDTSRNYNDYHLENVRITGLVSGGRFVYMYPRSVTVTKTAFTGNAGYFYYGGDTNSSGNDVWWASLGDGRNLNFNVNNSAFFDNTLAQSLWRFEDKTYLDEYKLIFDKNLFSNANAYNYGIWRANTYMVNGTTPSACPNFIITNNIIYTSTTRPTLFNGNKNYQLAPVNYVLNNNRIIGYNSAFQNITSEMDSWLSSVSWNYDNNYYAPSFTSTSDILGKAPVYASNGATVQPVDLANVPYYFDYAMTLNKSDLVVTGSSFEKNVDTFVINENKRTVSVVLKEGTTVTNPTFTTPNGVTAKLYKSATDKTEVTSFSYSDIGTADSINFYLEVSCNGVTASYTVNVSKWVDLPAFTAYAGTGAVKNTAMLLLPNDTYSTGAYVTAYFDGANYRFTVGTDAFSSVADAVKAGATQMILASNLAYTDITVNAAIELYGEDYESNPNTYSADKMTQPTLSSAWTDQETNTVVGGNITFTSATAGKTVKISGIELVGYIYDKARAVSTAKTSITFENILYKFNAAIAESGTVKVISLNNANAKDKTATGKNIDEFIFKNSRFDFVNKNTRLRLFEELGPATLTLEGNCFAEGFVALGYPKWQASVQNGTYTVKNNFFNKTSGTTGAVTYFEGFASNCAITGKTAKFICTDNIMIDCANTGYNSATNSCIETYPGAFTEINISGNTFVDTHNYYGYAVELTTKSDYSPINSSTIGVVKFDNNSVVGLTPFLYKRGIDGEVSGSNYYAYYTEDYKTSVKGERMFGYLEGNDFYIDFNRTALDSDMALVTSRKNAMVDTVNREASIIIEKDETYVSDFKTADGKYNFVLYSDEDCANSIGSLTADFVGGGRTIYAKAENGKGAYVVYKVYVSVGSLDAKEPATVGTANISNPYLYDVTTDAMPNGTKFVTTWQGTDYLFTKGVNAFASVSQITDAHSRNGSTGTPNVILPAGVLSEDVVVTKTVNFYGESAKSVMTSTPDTTSAVKIACVGDSITEGIGIDASERATYSYPAQLQTFLNNKYGTGAYKVGNFGWGGSTVNIMSNRELGSNWTYWTYIYTVQYYMSQDYNPDIVVIMMGHNDTHNVFYTTPETYKERYQALIDTYRSLPSHPTVVIAGCTGRGASQRQDYLTRTIIPIQKELAEENNLTYIDMYTPTIDLVGDATYFGDGLHGTKLGYELIASLIGNGMEDILTSSRTCTTDVTVDASQRVEKTPKTKVACIGDSLTYGDKSYRGYPVYLQEMLGDAYEVRNFGECGAIACDEDTLTGSKNWCYKSYTRYTQSKAWDPDIVIMMLGFNDAGGHLTDFHNGINWTGGASSTAATEFYEDYKALVKEYVDLGAKVYCVSAPSNLGDSATGTRNAYINPIIKKVAGELGLEYYDIWSVTNKWTADSYCGTNSTGTTDNTHFSAKGYEAVAQYMFNNLFNEFSRYYHDDAGEISSDAVVVDYQASSSLSSGAYVTYSWEGTEYSFQWGANAFSNINDAIDAVSARGLTELQVLIPENSIVTPSDAGINAMDFCTDYSKLTSIEIFGQNRLFDPNDRSASSSDTSADWTRNKNWDKWSTNGGTSAIGRVSLACKAGNNFSSLAGILKFKGVTLRSIVWDSERVIATAADPKSLDLVFENCLVDFTAKTTSGGKLFNLHNPRAKSSNTAFESGDTFTLKNFRVERYYFSNNRILETWSAPNITIDGFYYNGSYNSGYTLDYFGWFQTAPANKSASVIIKNSNFRNASVQFKVAPITNNAVAANKPTVYAVTNNVFYNTMSSKSVVENYAKYYTDFKVEGNVVVQPTGTVGFMSNFANHTATDVNYVTAAKYSAKNNTFVLADPSSQLGTLIINAATTGVDVTGTYLAPYDSAYATAEKGTDITALSSSYKADYWYVDYMRRIKNTDFEITSLGFEDEVKTTAISNKTINVTAEPGVTLKDLTLTTKNSLITYAFYSDANLTTKVTSITLPTSASDTKYYIGLNYGDYTEKYTVTFTVGNPVTFKGNYTDEAGIVTDDAVALTSAVSGIATGTNVVLKWQGKLYSFTAGVNAFATTANISTALGNGKRQIIMPAGDYTSQVELYGSWSLYGEGYNVSPNLKDGDAYKYNTAWSEYGESVIKNTNLVIRAEATPTTAEGTEIVVAGVKLTKYYNDAQRKVSNYKTTITLKNCVFDRAYLNSEGREFDLRNANNKCEDAANYTNIDEFNIVNMHYINTIPNGGHALLQELGPAFVTIDNFVCLDKTPSFGYPKVTKTSKKTSYTLTNSYFKNLTDASARWNFLFDFSGHNENVTSAERANYDSTLNITNNTFIDCADDSNAIDSTVRGVIEIYPQSYNDINVTGNTAISTKDGDYQFIRAMNISYSLNDGDYSDRFDVTNNRFIGLMASCFINDETDVDLSENFFTNYTSNYKTASGDQPADTDADYYLDYNLTTKISDLEFDIPTLTNLTFNHDTFTAYGYTSASTVALDTIKAYSDAACTTNVTHVTVNENEAAKVYVKPAKNGYSDLYTLYIMGVGDVADIKNATVDPATVDGYKTPAVWYPTLYGAPNGMTVYATFNGTLYGFTTGSRVVTSAANMAIYSNELLLPDTVTSFTQTIMSGVSVRSAVISTASLTYRKLKIACVGDSITQGVGSTTQSTDSYPAQLQTYFGTTDIEVKNFGKSAATVQTLGTTNERGYTTFAKTEYDASIAYKPDVVIFALGTNDTYAGRWKTNDAYIKEYIEIIRSYQALETKPAIYVTLALHRWDNAMMNVRVVNNLHDMQRIVAKAVGAKMIDTYTAMKPYANTTYFPDKLHPSTAGYTIMSENIGEAILANFNKYGTVGATVNDKLDITAVAAGTSNLTNIKFNNAGRSVVATLDGATANGISVTFASTPATLKVYSDAACTVETSLSGVGTYYLRGVNGNKKGSIYTLVVKSGAVGYFDNTFVDENGIIMNTALAVDNTITAADNSEVVVEWLGTDYKFVVGKTIFKSLDALYTYADSQNITDLQVVVTNWVGADFRVTRAGDYYAPNYNTSPFIKTNGEYALDWDGSSDWKENDEYMSRADIVKPVNIYVTGATVTGDVTFYGFTHTGKVVENRTSTGDLHLKLVNTYKTGADGSANKLFDFDGDSNIKGTNKAANADSFTIVNYYVKQLKSGDRFFTENVPAHITIDGLWCDGVSSLLNNNRCFPKVQADNASFTIKNSHLRNWWQAVALNANQGQFQLEPYSKGDIGDRTYIVSYDNNILYNFSNHLGYDNGATTVGYKTRTFYIIRLPGKSVSDVRFTNNYVSNPIAKSTGFFHSSNSAENTREDGSIVITGNTFNGVDPNFQILDGSIYGLDKMVLNKNFLVNKYTDDIENAVGNITTTAKGTTGEYGFWLDYARTMYSDKLYTMTIDGANILNTNDAYIDDTGDATTVDIKKYIENKYVNRITAYMDPELTIPANLSSIAVAAAGTDVYLVVKSPDGISESKVVTVHIVKDNDYYVDNIYAGADKINDTHNMLSWRGSVTGTGDYAYAEGMTFGGIGSNESFGVIYMAASDNLDNIKAALTNGKDDIESAVAAINSNETYSASAYVDVITDRKTAWNELTQSYTYVYRFNVKDGNRRATVMYAVYEDANGDKQIVFSDIDVRTSVAD